MKTCLIVDDYDLDRDMLHLMLERYDFLLLEAGSGEDALAACEASLPDVIVLDWEMEGISGIDFLKDLRNMPGGKDVFVLMCTAKSKPSHVGHAYAEGANGYIIKPFTVQLLAEKLKEYGLIDRPPSSARG